MPELREGPQLAPDVLLGDVVQQGQPGQVQVQVGHFLLGAPLRGSSCLLFSFETDYFCFPFKVCLFFCRDKFKKFSGKFEDDQHEPSRWPVTLFNTVTVRLAHGTPAYLNCMLKDDQKRLVCIR